MDTFKKIEQDLKEALKKSDGITTGTLRMLKSDIMYEKTKSNQDLTEDFVIEIITRAAKRRKESIEEFTKAKRSDLADTEAKELEIIRLYLPEQLSDGKISEIIDQKIEALGNITEKDFGKIMGMLMKELKGKADGNSVKQILSKKLKNKS
jgi:uncharacterized protein